MANASDRIPVQQYRFITTLEYMPIRLTKAIETIGQGRLQPLHPFHQVPPGCFHAQMVMVAHQNPCMRLPALRLAAQIQAFKKAFTRTGGFKIKER